MRAQKKDWCGVIVALCFGLVVLASVGPVMRESDQASLLDGAIQLARDGNFFREDAYNYSVQFGTYWILASFFWLFGIGANGVDPDWVVHSGNLIAAVIFVAGISLLLVRRFPKGLLGRMVCLSVLLSPVVLFSSSLLSTNIVSVGFLGVLVWLLSGKESWGRDVLVAVSGFAAVACRGDAVLLFPFLSLLSAEKRGFWEVLRVRRLWLLGVAAVLALLIGRILAGEGADQYAAYFYPKVAFVYLLFGLGGAGIVLLALVFLFSGMGKGRDRVWFVLVSLSMLIPLGFYLKMLMTPRHLLLVALTPLFLVCFSQGVTFFNRSLSKRVVGWTSLTIFILSCAPLVFGLELRSTKHGQIVSKGPTLYPTADGYWPMGCYGQFLFWLRGADRVSLDHNQRVWNAWKELADVPVKPGGVRVSSKGLASYGRLRVTLLGQQSRLNSDAEQYQLVTTRYFSKVNVARGEGGRKPSQKTEGGIQQLAEAQWEEVLLLNRSGNVLTNENKVLNLLANISGGNDYLVGKREDEWESLRGAGPFKWVFFSERNGSWVGREIVAGRSGWRKAERQESWVARSSLAAFFNLDEYSK